MERREPTNGGPPAIPQAAPRRRSSTGLIRAVAAKELLELARDGRFRVLGAVVGGLLVLSLAFGWQESRKVLAERTAAQATAEEHFLDQGEKSPHAAAHYGKYVFKPTGPLSFLDPGVEPHLGVTMKLEAHKRGLPADAASRDGTAVQRFGQLSVAAVLQLLVPLLIIAIGFGAWSGERERGTLRQVASLGVEPRILSAGKAIGLSLALLVLLVPAIVAGVAVAALFGGEGAVSPLRLLGVAAAYSAYFAAFVAITLYTSARSSSSRVALVGLVAFWGVAGLIAPRLAADVAEAVAPLPTAQALAADIRTSLRDGLPGQPREQRVESVSTALLEQYGFKDAEMMMDEGLLRGIELQSEARFEEEVFDHHFSGLFASMDRQERVVQWASVFSPVLAVRALSAGLCGTDFAHHHHFAEAAEIYRRELVAALNDAFAQNAGAAGWSYQAGREVWETAPAFAYTAPTVGWAARRVALPAALLLAWLLVAALAARRAVATMRVF